MHVMVKLGLMSAALEPVVMDTGYGNTSLGMMGDRGGVNGCCAAASAASAASATPRGVR